ncbi:MAG: zinc ribbon domain-containing protein [Ruminococcus sp.]|nr:zinc ribbon domain-containing protein [Ruminococcus sp.]
MAKFCTTCGATLDDSATFCTNCGTPQQPSAAPAAVGAGATPAANAAAGVKNAFNSVKENVNPKEIIDSMTIDNIKNITKNPNKNTIIGLSVCGGVLLIVIIILCALLFGKPYKKALNKYFDAMEDCNGKKYISVTMADFMKEKAEDDLDDEYDSLEEEYDAYLEDIKEAAEDDDDIGDNPKYSYKIKKVKKVKDSKLKSAQKYYKKRYDLDSDEVKVTKGYEVKCKVTIKGDEGDDSETTTYYVLKVNGDWIVSGWLPSLDDDDD